MNYKITLIKKHTDERGDLVVFLRNRKIGQIYFVTFNHKGIIRGNHYHKKWKEWFGIVTGCVKCILKDVKTGEWEYFILNSSDKNFLLFEIDVGIAHAFESLRPQSSILNYANTEWTGKDDFKYKLI